MQKCKGKQHEQHYQKQKEKNKKAERRERNMKLEMKQNPKKNKKNEKENSLKQCEDGEEPWRRRILLAPKRSLHVFSLRFFPPRERVFCVHS